MDLEHTIDKFCLKAVTNLDLGTIAVSCMQNGSKKCMVFLSQRYLRSCAFLEVAIFMMASFTKVQFNGSFKYHF